MSSNPTATFPIYIKFPVETNPDTLAQDVYDYIVARAAQWVADDGNLDVWIIQAMTAIAAEVRDLASDFPTEAFRFFGSSLVGLPPIDASRSTVPSTWVLIDNSGHLIPAGTVVGIRNSVGDLIPFEVVADVIVPPGSTTTAAGGVLLRSVNTGANTSGLGGVGIVASLVDILDFVTSITLTAVTTGGIDAETNDQFLNRLSRHMQLLSTRPILPRDFANLGRDVAGVYRIAVIDGYNPTHNLLTANQASAETDASGTANISNTTVASSSAQAADGAKSVSLTAVAAADVIAAAPATPATGIAVTPGDTVTALVSLRAATTIRSCQAGIQWVDAANAQIGSIVYGTAANDSAAAFVNYSVSAVAPALAVRARVVFKVIAAAIGEVHYADKMSLRRGTGAATDWVAGGTAETGNERMVTFSAIDINGTDVSTPVRSAVQALLDSNREVNFIVNSMVANRTQIDVTYTAKVLSGFSAATVQAAINSALQAYLNAATWGVNGSVDPQEWTDVTVVRYSDIGAIISNTEGVDYWTSLTIGIHNNALAAADVTIPGPAALAIWNTITATVT